MREYLNAIAKLAVMLCVSLSYLLAHNNPAMALSTYDAVAGATIDAFSPPAGTGLIVTLGAGSTSTPSRTQIGNAQAYGNAGTGPYFWPVQQGLGFATVEVGGSASAPPASLAASFASAVLPMVLFNHNNETEAFRMGFSSFSGSRVTFGQNERAHAHAAVRLLLDGNELANDIDGVVTTFVPATNPIVGYWSLTFQLEPGLHSLRLDAEADGFASAQLEPTPEPATLLLWGTGAAGLGVARWVKRRRSHEHAA